MLDGILNLNTEDFNEYLVNYSKSKLKPLNDAIIRIEALNNTIYSLSKMAFFGLRDAVSESLWHRQLADVAIKEVEDYFRIFLNPLEGFKVIRDNKGAKSPSDSPKYVPF
jgi:hypothetical protein